MEFLNEYMIPIVSWMCLCVGYVIKNWIKDLDNKYIPTIVCVLGIFYAVWVEGKFDANVVFCGAISGLSSTGLHQAFKQFIESAKKYRQ